MSILSYRSLASWRLGYPEAALADADQAINEAREIGHAATLIYALWHASLTHTLCGNYTKASAHWRSHRIGGRKRTLVLEGVRNGGPWLRICPDRRSFGGNSNGDFRPLTHVSVNGSNSIFPRCICHTWLAPMRNGQLDDAWRCIDEAMTAIEATKETWCEAEVNRIAGEIALKSPEPDAAKAQAYFERALAVARQQQAKSWELRAAMSMARLWRDQGKPQQARELLAPVYGWFTEGFDTLDLKEAKALLEGLGS